MREEAAGTRNRRPKVKRTKYIDYTLLIMIILLLGFGLVMLYSTSAYNATLKTGNSAFYLKKQVQAACIGFVLMYICVKMDYHIFRRFAYIAYAFSFILCFAVIFTGHSSHGQSRWIYIGPISFQPSELAKVAVILFIATVLSSRPRAMRSFQNNLKLFLILLPVGGVVVYNNLSTGIIIMGIAVLMIFIASTNWRGYFALGGAVAIVAVLFVLISAKYGDKLGYRFERVMVWLNPEEYEKGYQTLQGLYAIGSGGLFGKGLGESIQKLGFVPEAQNDMIFSIICEELGLFGAICVILMFILLLWRLLLIAINAKDMFGSYLVIGILIHIALQVILNISVVTNTIPNTGVTLPFISYGGTSIMFLLAEMGVALSVSKDMQSDV